ncbi:MAG: DUF4124 domain-containing protein [Cellvibrionaceae bacterium]|nr:DUF4124 domain-containing protein [Cellvibrionaceae bacterium]MCV6626748.1 DUF4124 domain-containing protein [Cellvibrionaceae bacterium]
MKVFLILCVIIAGVLTFAPHLVGLADEPEPGSNFQVNDDLGKVQSTLQQWWVKLQREVFGEANAGKTKAYRWQDAQGNWHLSDTPNPKGRAEEVWVDPNIDLMSETVRAELEAKSPTQAPLNAVPLPDKE